ncbi:MAG TPA: ribonuclease HI [Pseudomonadaceae bacterium]|nr:ribonuclease HI [Pseudomonadaceae bacterium]
MTDKTVVLYTDGACRGNPGPGGWGAVLEYNGNVRTLHGGEPATTNNRMEMTAVIKGLEALKTSCQVKIVTDSRYVLQGMTEWLPNWKKKGWRTAGGKPVMNSDLWQLLEKVAARHQLQWQWVKGHSGHPQNEQADQLANLGIDELQT